MQPCFDVYETQKKSEEAKQAKGNEEEYYFFVCVLWDVENEQEDERAEETKKEKTEFGESKLPWKGSKTSSGRMTAQNRPPSFKISGFNKSGAAPKRLTSSSAPTTHAPKKSKSDGSIDPELLDVSLLSFCPRRPHYAIVAVRILAESH